MKSNYNIDTVKTANWETWAISAGTSMLQYWQDPP